MTQCYYSHKGQQFGPVTDQQLQQLADSGQLQPTDMVWKKGMAQWVPAETITGLTFVTSDKPPPLPDETAQAILIDEPQSSRQNSSVAPAVAITTFWNQHRENPIFIGALLVFCFPLGLFLVWKHSSWTNKTKWIWTGVWAALVVVGMIGNRGDKPTRLDAGSGGSSSDVTSRAAPENSGADEVGIDAEELVHAFDNEAAGAAKYSGKRIKIQGKVVNVEKDYVSYSLFASKQYAIVLGGDPGPNGYTTWVKCFVPNAKDAASVRAGGRVWVRGTVQGRKLDEVRVTDCEVLEQW